MEPEIDIESLFEVTKSIYSILLETSGLDIHQKEFDELIKDEYEVKADEIERKNLIPVIFADIGMRRLNNLALGIKSNKNINKKIEDYKIKNVETKSTDDIVKFGAMGKRKINLD